MFKSRATRHVIFALLGVGAAFLAAASIDKPAQANDHHGGGYHVVYDDFKHGFTVGNPGDPAAKWFYFADETYVGDDGIESTSRRGLHVDASGENPHTGLPAFINTLAQEHVNGGIPGGVDHVKWLVYMNTLSSHGFPGIDAVPGQEIACESWLGGETYGTEFQPFGHSIKNPDDDLRLAAFAANSLDFESFMVFDWFVTNETIYAFYERLPFGREALGDYAAFSFAIPVARTHPDEKHHYKTALDKSKGTVRWVLDGEEVFKVDKIGFRIDRKYMTLDHGGTEGLVSPNQLACGMGMFTLLDAFLPSKQGLARLSDDPNLYFDPRVGEPTVEQFIDPQSKDQSRLFGQGASIDVKKIVVSSRPTDNHQHDHDEHDGHDDDCDHD